MSEGRVVEIYIGPEPEGPVRRVDEVTAVAGRGLEGDRYFQPPENGVPDKEITLIESEAIAAAAEESGVDIKPPDARRNVVTAGVRLDELVGKMFSVGEVEVEAIEPNPPCNHLQQLAGKPLLRPLARRGGVRGRIVTGGVIRAGDPISAANP
jgi:MOSC domain-containing protein YiiM